MDAHINAMNAPLMANNVSSARAGDISLFFRKLRNSVTPGKKLILECVLLKQTLRRTYLLELYTY